MFFKICIMKLFKNYVNFHAQKFMVIDEAHFEFHLQLADIGRKTTRTT